MSRTITRATITLETTVERITGTAAAARAEASATRTHAECFEASAIATATVTRIDGLKVKGQNARNLHSASAVARAVKAAAEVKGRADRFDYTSTAAIGFHARTGAFLLLPGAMPRGADGAVVTPMGVQAIIKRVGAAGVDPILNRAEDRAGAYAALIKADRSKTAGKRAKVTTTGTPDVTTPDVTTPDVTTPDVTDVTTPDVTTPDVPDVTPVADAIGTVIVASLPASDDDARVASGTRDIVGRFSAGTVGAVDALTMLCALIGAPVPTGLPA